MDSVEHQQMSKKLCAWIAACLAFAWIALAPGPKHEEMFFAAAFSVPIALCALISAALEARPDPARLAPCWVLWFVGWSGMSVRVSLAYGYPLFNSRALIYGIVILVAGVAASFCVSLACSGARRAWGSQREAI